MTTKTYFYDHVAIVVEIEPECGGRYRKVCHGDAQVKAYCDRHDGEISDVDFCATQADPRVKKVLNTAYLNFTKNRDWCKRHNLTSLWGVVDFILDNGLV